MNVILEAWLTLKTPCLSTRVETAWLTEESEKLLKTFQGETWE